MVGMSLHIWVDLRGTWVLGCSCGVYVGVENGVYWKVVVVEEGVVGLVMVVVVAVQPDSAGARSWLAVVGALVGAAVCR